MPRIRSEFQRAIGLQNLERELDKMAVDPKMLASMDKMYEDIRSGRRAEYDDGVLRLPMQSQSP